MAASAPTATPPSRSPRGRNRRPTAASPRQLPPLLHVQLLLLLASICPARAMVIQVNRIDWSTQIKYSRVEFDMCARATTHERALRCIYRHTFHDKRPAPISVSRPVSPGSRSPARPASPHAQSLPSRICGNHPRACFLPCPTRSQPHEPQERSGRTSARTHARTSPGGCRLAAESSQLTRRRRCRCLAT